jgi:hypothetical protein
MLTVLRTKLHPVTCIGALAPTPYAVQPHVAVARKEPPAPFTRFPTNCEPVTSSRGAWPVAQ